MPAPPDRKAHDASAPHLRVAGFLIRRVTLGVAALAGVSFVSFAFFASTNAPYRNHPLLPEYWTWLNGIWRGSSLDQFPPGQLVGAVGRTSALLLFALMLVVMFSIALAAVAVWSPRSTLDVSLRVVSYVLWGIPAFLLALVVQEVLQTLGSAHGFGPFPIAGWPGSCPAGLGIDAGTINPCPSAGTGLHYLLNVARYLTIPAFTLAAAFVGLHGRYLRTALVEVQHAQFVVTARAKGVSRQGILFRHTLRAALPTFAAALLSDFGTILGAALAIDWLFQVHGVGWLFISQFPQQDSFAPLDVYALQLLVLVIATTVIVGSLLGEVAVLIIDPRHRDAL